MPSLLTQQPHFPLHLSPPLAALLPALAAPVSNASSVQLQQAMSMPLPVPGLFAGYPIPAAMGLPVPLVFTPGPGPYATVPVAANGHTAGSIPGRASTYYPLASTVPSALAATASSLSSDGSGSAINSTTVTPAVALAAPPLARHAVPSLPVGRFEVGHSGRACGCGTGRCARERGRDLPSARRCLHTCMSAPQEAKHDPMSLALAAVAASRAAKIAAAAATATGDVVGGSDNGSARASSLATIGGRASESAGPANCSSSITSGVGSGAVSSVRCTNTVNAATASAASTSALVHASRFGGQPRLDPRAPVFPAVMSATADATVCVASGISTASRGDHAGLQASHNPTSGYSDHGRTSLASASGLSSDHRHIILPSTLRDPLLPLAGPHMINCFLGSRISMVSQAAIRYEGTLVAIDSENQTISLQNGAYWCGV
jgi:hypothetical protein